MERTLAGLDGWPVNVGLQAGARDRGRRAPGRAARRRRVRLQDPRGLRRLPGADRPRPALRRRARRLRLAAHGRPARVRGARGHGRRDRRPDRPRLSRRGDAAAATCPDLLGLVREPNIICSSTTPTIPFGVDAAAEQRPDDRAQPRRVVRRRPTTSRWSASGSTPRRWPPRARSTSSARSGSSTPTRRGWAGSMETVRRTIQLAHVMKAWRATEAGRGHPGLPDDRTTPSTTTDRVLRYLAKVTIEPAITHGIADARRVAAAGPARGHRPVEPGLLRREAGARAQGRLSGLGAARRGQRDGRASRADPLPAGLGRPGRGRRRPVGDVRVGPGRGRAGRRCAAGARRATDRRGRADAGPDPGGAGAEPRDGPDRDRPARRPGHAGRAAARGRARPTDLPLNRRYFLR